MTYMDSKKEKSIINLWLDEGNDEMLFDGCVIKQEVMMAGVVEKDMEVTINWTSLESEEDKMEKEL